LASLNHFTVPSAIYFLPTKIAANPERAARNVSPFAERRLNDNFLESDLAVQMFTDSEMTESRGEP
jgi:hypothetical protein